MFRLSNAIQHMFSSFAGEKIYSRILRTIKNEDIEKHIDNGILIGLSGGADSVFLTCFLTEYKRRNNKSFSILAVHVNHYIRGEEAGRDENFSKDFAEALGLDFESRSIDVPALSKELSIGLEEAARNIRYSIFNEIISGRNDINSIAVAHNATDNIETVIMNMLRGSGLSGMCGIKPVRDNIIRPLISISKSEIVSLLDDNDIPYVIDSTNLCSDYSRNYVRNEILPLFHRLTNDPEAQISRLTENLRSDLNYLNSQANEFINSKCPDKIYAGDLRSLHSALRARVLSILIHKNTCEYPEEKHIAALNNLLNRDNFSYSLPGDKDLICQRGICTFSPKNAMNNLEKVIFSLSWGENKVYGTNLTVFVGDVDNSSLNVYNFSIQAELSSAIIGDGLIIRFKSDGDSYRYSGMTHKLKKVFNDRNIPSSERSFIPILCDSKGIVYVPGLSVRDGAKSDISSENVSITFAFGTPEKGETEVFTALLRK